MKKTSEEIIKGRLLRKHAVMDHKQKKNADTVMAFLKLSEEEKKEKLDIFLEFLKDNFYSATFSAVSFTRADGEKMIDAMMRCIKYYGGYGNIMNGLVFQEIPKKKDSTFGRYIKKA